MTGPTLGEAYNLKLEAEIRMAYSSIEFTVEPTDVLGEIQLTLDEDSEALARTLSENEYSPDQLKEFKSNDAAERIEGDSA